MNHQSTAYQPITSVHPRSISTSTWNAVPSHASRAVLLRSCAHAMDVGYIPGHPDCCVPQLRSTLVIHQNGIKKSDMLFLLSWEEQFQHRFYRVILSYFNTFYQLYHVLIFACLCCICAPLTLEPRDQEFSSGLVSFKFSLERKLTHWLGCQLISNCGNPLRLQSVLKSWTTWDV